jgi:hypothetical protein
VIARDGERGRVWGDRVPSAAWETVDIPELWRATEHERRDAPLMDAHDLLRYALLLRSMQERFDKDDAAEFFNDALFFLRGGYDFFCHLNLSSSLNLRGRIFGGLSHALRPKERLQAWYRRLIEEALARGHGRVDVLIADEVNSGSGVNRIVKLLEAATELVASELPAAELSINFVYYVCALEGSAFNEAHFIERLDAKDRRLYQRGKLTVYNRFTLFCGPLLTYDAEALSGLDVISKNSDKLERYACIKYTVPFVRLVCPETQRSIYDCAPGTNDFPTFLGVTILEWLGTFGSRIAYDHLADRITRDGCEECHRLYARLRASKQTWEARDLCP